MSMIYKNNKTATRGKALLLMAIQNGNVRLIHFPPKPPIGPPPRTQTYCSPVASPVTNDKSELTVKICVSSGLASVCKGFCINAGEDFLSC